MRPFWPNVSGQLQTGNVSLPSLLIKKYLSGRLPGRGDFTREVTFTFTWRISSSLHLGRITTLAARNILLYIYNVCDMSPKNYNSLLSRMVNSILVFQSFKVSLFLSYITFVITFVVILSFQFVTFYQAENDVILPFNLIIVGLDWTR